MAVSNQHLSRSLEDYLEAIYNLKVRCQKARVKDIAHELGVKMPSVTGALRSLSSKGFVSYQPYECVELTQEGLDHARDIAHRHSAVKEFLVGILGLKEEDAEVEACGIEHAIKPETLDRILTFVDFVRATGEDKPLRINDFHRCVDNGINPEELAINHQQCPGRRGRGPKWLSSTITFTKLSNLRPGMNGRIAFVSGRGPIRKRLLDMGLTSDTKFEVIRVAPLGDPVEIKVRGYLLSLRKSEAEQIEVEVE